MFDLKLICTISLHEETETRDLYIIFLIVFLANICNMTPFFASHGKTYET